MAAVEPLRDKKDIELMKNVLRNRNIRHYLLFIVGCNMGLRISDILKMKVYDLVNEKGGVHKIVTITEQKTGRVREISINVSIQKAVKVFASTMPDTNDSNIETTKMMLKTFFMATTPYVTGYTLICSNNAVNPIK